MSVSARILPDGFCAVDRATMTLHIASSSSSRARRIRSDADLGHVESSWTRGKILIFLLVTLLAIPFFLWSIVLSSAKNESYPSAILPGLSSLETLESMLLWKWSFLGQASPKHQPVPPRPNRSQVNSVLTKLQANLSRGVLNVHVVPHTHDDVGWRKTVEQYYRGTNNSIDTRGAVHDILSTVLESLLEQPARTFTYVEQKFLSWWWKEQSVAVRKALLSLIRPLEEGTGQFYIVNGGWCMHDEATAHYMGMIDQTTLGHDFLEQTLQVIPTVAWQLDPFGHSYTQAHLMTAAAGMDALYFGRIDAQDLQVRQLTRQCEGLWQTGDPPSPLPPPNMNEISTTTTTSTGSTIFWGLTGSYQGNYGPFDGYCFDVLCGDEPLVGANATRLWQRIQTFLQDLTVQADRTQGQHVMLTMGSDFHFSKAHVNFDNLDLLIGSIMNYQQWGMLNIPELFGPRFDRINMFYSTPAYYTQQKNLEWQRQQQSAQPAAQSESKSLHEITASESSVSLAYDRVDEPISWRIKTDDFFPYADCSHCYWTGYFTSRTAFKRFERVSSGFLMAARQIDVLATWYSSPTTKRRWHESHEEEGDDKEIWEQGPLFPLEDALGVAQHHDAISGTAKQHVADDYSKRIQTGLDLAAQVTIENLKEIMLPSEGQTGFLENLSFCPLLNESICEITEKSTFSVENVLYTIIYNPLPTNRSTVVRLPVAVDGMFQISRVGNGGNLESGSATIVSTVRLSAAEKPVLVFDTGMLPPLGAASFQITRVENGVKIGQSVLELSQQCRDSIRLGNNFFSASFDCRTGSLQHMSNQDTSLNISQSWGYYTSFDSESDSSEVPGSGQKQNSGAYIFRPKEPTQDLVPLVPRKDAALIVNTSAGLEIHVFFEEPWVRQINRIIPDQEYLEVEYLVGPIPIQDGRGREIVTRFTTPIESQGEVYTDSNARHFLKRRRNVRPSWDLDVYEPVTGNYYPVNAAIYIQDSDASLSVLVDRSQGGASLVDGTLELMVQRRTLADDERGVDEPMNETCGGMTPYPPYGQAKRVGEGVTVRGTHRILVGKGSVGASLARSSMDRVFAEPLIFVASSPKSKPVTFRRAAFSGLARALPPNVGLLTLARRTQKGPNILLLRLGHQYGWSDDESLSKPVQVNLTDLLIGCKVMSLVEKTLTGNRNWTEFVAHRLNWTSSSAFPEEAAEWHRISSDSMVTLAPMQIRTFEVACEMHKNNS